MKYEYGLIERLRTGFTMLCNNQTAKQEFCSPSPRYQTQLVPLLQDVFLTARTPLSERKIDWEKLQATLGKENIEFRNERYVLNWAGKSEAFKVLQKAGNDQLKTNTVLQMDDAESDFKTI